MYNEVRLWWKYEGKYYHKDFIQGIKNLWKWFPTIWKDRDWDHNFIYALLVKKLEFQADFIGRKGIHVTAEHDANRMRLVANLIIFEQADFYNMEYMDYAEDMALVEFCQDHPEYSTWESETIWENYDDYFAKYPTWYKRANQVIKDQQNLHRFPITKRTDKQLVAMVMGDLRQKKCKDLIFKLMNQNIDMWWD